MSYSRSRARLEEALTIVRAFLEKGSASYQGRDIQPTRGQPGDEAEYRKGCLSTWRLSDPEALKTAGALADGVLLNAYVSPGYVRYAVGLVREAAKEAGRDPNSVRVACMLVMRMTPRPEEIRPGLKQRLVRLIFRGPNVGEILLETAGFDPANGLVAAPTCMKKDDMKGALRLVTDEHGGLMLRHRPGGAVPGTGGGVREGRSGRTVAASPVGGLPRMWLKAMAG